MNFAQILALLMAQQANFAFRIANRARPANEYLLNTFLPEELRTSWVAESGSMTILTIMAGMVGMDSPYPEAGFIKSDEIREETWKIANRQRLTEKNLRDIHELVRSVRDGVIATGGTLDQANQAGNRRVAEIVLNFTDKIIVQGHLDTFEFLRGQGLSTGKLEWNFNGIDMKVDYNVPTTHKISRSGGDGYGGATSKFWTDMRTIRRLLKGEVAAILTHPNTFEMILSQAANNIEITMEDNATGVVEFVRLVGTNERRSTDARERVRLVRYGKEGTVIDETDPTKTKNLPFFPEGVITAIGANEPRGMNIANDLGVGSTEDVNRRLRVGYTHIAPTIEGGGTPGRWANVFVPQEAKWTIEGEGVTNGVPVIENPDKLVILNTPMV